VEPGKISIGEGPGKTELVALERAYFKGFDGSKDRQKTARLATGQRAKTGPRGSLMHSRRAALATLDGRFHHTCHHHGFGSDEKSE
jgi:hypothetical protein